MTGARNMVRSALVALLNARRDNDVMVSVPEGGGEVRLFIRSVGYDPTSDQILIVTEKWFGDPLPKDPAAAQAEPGGA